MGEPIGELKPIVFEKIIEEKIKTNKEILDEILEGENKMIKIKITNKLSSLSGFEKCFREDKIRLESGMIEKGTILYVDKEMFSYINGDNKFRRKCCDLLEVVEDFEEIKIEN